MVAISSRPQFVKYLEPHLLSDFALNGVIGYVLIETKMSSARRDYRYWMYYTLHFFRLFFYIYLNASQYDNTLFSFTLFSRLKLLLFLRSTLVLLFYIDVALTLSITFAFLVGIKFVPITCDVQRISGDW